MLSFDPDKNKKNIEKHGLALADAELFDFGRAIETTQNEEGEERIKAVGVWSREFLAVVVFVEYGEADKHIISARRANRRETEEYVREKSSS